jgi:hypothetical protein
MTFDEYASKSVNNFISLIEVDILTPNIQWVNNGAGIWACNFNNIYSWVDAELLDGFTSQSFGDIGSVTINGVSLLRVNSIPEIGATPGTFYYSAVTKDLYICTLDYTSPYINIVNIGVLYGFTDKSFQPLGANSEYNNCILSMPSIDFSRDPLFYGKLSFPDISFSVNNGDGSFDTFAEDNNIYGNPARVKIGFEELDITEYKTIFTGYVSGNVNVTEENASFTISDKRKQFSKSINYACTNKNALTIIEELLAQNYSIPYNATLYNIVNWETVKALVPNVSINTQSATPVINIIELICKSVFGIFYITAEGLFDFILIDDSKAGTDFIPTFDILNKFDIAYDPSQVISSTKIGYARNWATSESAINAYTFLTDTSYEDSVFDKYKVYIEKNINTLLINITDAQAFSDNIMEYNKNVHGIVPITIPIKYYAVVVGDNILFEIDRIGKNMLYLRKCEVLSKQYDLGNGLINLSCRIVKEMFVRVTTTGAIRVLTTGEVRIS